MSHPPPTCPYCGAAAVLVDGSAIYPQRPDLYDKRFWLCDPCDAYVGCHPGTTKPLGRLADETLRLWKRRAHAAFDPLWKGGGMHRSQAYAWLAHRLDIDGRDCHIGMFSVKRCKAVVKACEERNDDE